MSAQTAQMPGLDRIRTRFVELLQSRKTSIALHALGAWDGKTAKEISTNLEQARAILHQIAGTAGTVGYPLLGEAAQQCEIQIIAYLEGPHAGLANCPPEIIGRINAFVEACNIVASNG